MTEMQREALAVLAEVWALSPDVRLGQLMAHLEFLGEAHVGKGLGYIEDDELHRGPPFLPSPNRVKVSSWNAR